MLRGVVTSSSLLSVGYDGESETLEVEFRNGHVYRYDGVPRELYDGLRTSQSKGAYFNERIRDAFLGIRLR